VLTILMGHTDSLTGCRVFSESHWDLNMARESVCVCELDHLTNKKKKQNIN
jgi:hypothetical protein